jgi:hypothetical protein
MEIASTIYDNTHTWQNMQDRVSYQRAFATEDNLVSKKMAMAMILANPLTPAEEIREILTVPGVPPKIGYEQGTSPTLDDVFMGGIPDPQDPGTYPTDFSGSYGEYSGSDAPKLEWF